MKPFILRVPQQQLDDLRYRLEHTRYASPAPFRGPDAGISPLLLRRFVEYWAGEFDWRAAERRLNSYVQFTSDVDGVHLHFAHLRSARTKAPAIMLLHGWPYSFAEMLPLADALVDFTIVVPSLPGFLFSTVPDRYTATPPTVATTLHSLMTEHLGHEQYFVYGEDVGAPVSQWLAATHRDAVLGIHDTHAVFAPRNDLHTQEERHFYAWFDAQWDGAKGYDQPGSNRHDTIAASLADSPAGLAAWMLEKFRDWSDSGGDVESRFSFEQLATTITLYWLTDTFVSSFSPNQSGTPIPATPRIRVPATVAVQRHEHRYPSSFADRAYGDLRRFGYMPRGGHFAAAEEPQAVANDIRWLIDSVAHVA